ncbi:proline--tRNA ligase [candidate division WWE3 bacterium CG08_land_8_20_14_0_20_43_13]|uniref:Proline--tRNA ligase n=1 Tax=candidate division WWE3 bacterium CG08_land_8_20_14_0_20_43_13 TaxID=1975087 RepID=A0A2H0X6I9_UNCKA|nr:MAG: proline--tRNA ligase [candidate division WWE3 bacterium CG08_land_8_20_14_0_20_43_13]
MLYSQLFGKTVRNAPAEATLASHKLLHQAGYIRDLSAGRYSFLPLGQLVKEKIIKIIDQEMERIGSQRVSTPTLHPIELWEATNRDKAFGQGLMRIKDRRGSEFALGATAEGVMVDLVNKFNPSYKDLPIVIHQFSEKFRDELRARGGLVRVREFTMKDAYSFCATKESLEQVYEQMKQAYMRIAERLSIPVVMAQAISGAIGGKTCHEFFYLTSNGEDTIIRCGSCGYTANAEAAQFLRQDINSKEEEKPLAEVLAPNTVTAQQEAGFHKINLNQVLNCVIYKKASGEYIGALVLGDHQVNEAALAESVGISLDELTPATEQELKQLGTTRGYASPIGQVLQGKVRFFGDSALELAKNLVTGANREDVDLINANLGRDFSVEKIAPIAQAQNRDSCPECQKGVLKADRGIEFGHIFQLDHFYTRPLKGMFVDMDGQEKAMWNGSYGIGIGRAMACAVEASHDEKGIVWPKEITPFQVHLVSLGTDEKIKREASQLYDYLEEDGWQVLWDDREESAGVKFNDADLIGIPVRVVISQKSLEKGGFEFKERTANNNQFLTSQQLAKTLKKLYNN